jgi:hypothetical protein
MLWSCGAGSSILTWFLLLLVLKECIAQQAGPCASTIAVMQYTAL